MRSRRCRLPGERGACVRQCRNGARVWRRPRDEDGGGTNLASGIWQALQGNGGRDRSFFQSRANRPPIVFWCPRSLRSRPFLHRFASGVFDSSQSPACGIGTMKFRRKCPPPPRGLRRCSCKAAQTSLRTNSANSASGTPRLAWRSTPGPKRIETREGTATRERSGTGFNSFAKVRTRSKSNQNNTLQTTTPLAPPSPVSCRHNGSEP